MFESVKIREDFRALIPPLSEDERHGLEQSILEYGCRDALLTWNGWIVDGHNRYEICAGNGIEFRTEEMEFEDENAVKVWMIDNQLSRRNLTVFVKAELALKRKAFFAEKAKENLSLSGGRGVKGCQISDKVIDTKKELARLAGTSHNTINQVEHILNSGDEEVINKVKSGELSINHGNKLIKQKKKEQKRAETKESESNIAKSIKPEQLPADIRHGDFIDVLSDIPNGSLDAIITDPPYPHEFIEQWSRLSKFASEKLKPGGFCLTYSGQFFLPEVLQMMSEHLDYYWTLSLLHTGFSQFITPRNLFCNYKPILVFQNGFSIYKPEKTPLADVIDGTGRFKMNHEWEQGEDELDTLISYFTSPGQTICDPFAGSGTTLVKCVKMKRAAIGAEIEEKHFLTCKKRLKDVTV